MPEEIPGLLERLAQVFIDGLLATAVLLGLVLSAAWGYWWADPLAGYALVHYSAREVQEIFSGYR